MRRRSRRRQSGPRSDWILWQYPVFSALPQFEVGPPGADSYRTLPKLRLRDGERAEDIVLDNLGFADAALSSFAIFARLKRDGVIPAHVRFQVSLPTPLAPVSAFIDPEHRALVEPIYEAQVLRELDEIFAAVPHDQLALQWDTRLEFAILEGISPARFEGTRAGVLERLLRVSRAIPPDVELGFHLCYGDDYHGHFIVPDDTHKLVEVANALATAGASTWKHHRSTEMPAAAARKLRVVVAKPGLDGHDRGAKIIARALRDAGMEVIYTGLHQTPEQIVETVIQEDADAIGLSILSGAHMTLVPRIVALLRDQGVADVIVTVGGTIPNHDIPELERLGVDAVFTPGAALQDIIDFLQRSVGERTPA